MSFIFIACFGQILQGSIKTDIYTAYINGSMQSWKQIMDEMDKNRSTQPDYILELVNYQYGYIAWCLDHEKDNEAEKYLAMAGKNIEWLEGIGFNLSMINAYKAAFYGFRIGMAPIKSFYYGSKCVHCAQNAIDLDRENPYGYIQYGNTRYYTPAAFGGSKQEAIKYYVKAEMLMEKNPEQIKNDWNYLYLLTTIANAYIDTKQPEMARVYFEKILRVEPDYQWVKNELYPQFLNDLKK